MKIGKKLLISFTIIVAFLIISALVTTVYTLRINNKLHKITEEVNPLETDVQDMISILWRSNYIVQRFSTEDDLETLGDLEFEFEHINDLFTKKSERVAELGSEDIKEKVSQATNKHNTFYQLSKRLMDKRSEDVANRVVYAESSILVQYSIAKQLERDVVDAVEFLQESLEEFATIKQTAKQESNAAVKVAITMIILIALIGILESFFFLENLSS